MACGVGAAAVAAPPPSSLFFADEASSSSSPTLTRRKSGDGDASDRKQPLFIPGPPAETKPNYDEIHGALGETVDMALMSLFRSRLAERVGVDSDRPPDDFTGLMELTAAMNARYSDREEVHVIAQDTLRELS